MHERRLTYSPRHQTRNTLTRSDINHGVDRDCQQPLLATEIYSEILFNQFVKQFQKQFRDEYSTDVQTSIFAIHPF